MGSFMAGSMYFPSVTALYLAQPLIYVDEVERCADATSMRGGSFSEDVRCLREAWGRGGTNGVVRFEQPFGEGCYHLPVC
jgi:hypothetical protein